MNYESWRITYQSSEQAARAAFKTVEQLHNKNMELENKTNKEVKKLTVKLKSLILINIALSALITLLIINIIK